MKLERDKNLEDQILALLDKDQCGNLNVYCLERVNSVLDAANIILEQETSGNSLLISKSQSTGRGQKGRSWISCEGAFLACYILQNINLPLKDLSSFSLVVALCIAQALADYNLQTKVKWPNDVLVANNKKKIAGVLLEAGSKNSNRFLNIGIGVNLTDHPEYGSSVLKETGAVIDFADFTANLTKRIINSYELFRENGFVNFLEEWKNSDALNSAKIEFESNNQIFKGKYQGIDRLGRVLLNVDGEQFEFYSGQIEKIQW